MVTGARSSPSPSPSPSTAKRPAGRASAALAWFRSTLGAAGQISLAYAIAGWLWIYASDSLLASWLLDPDRLTRYQTIKDSGLVAVTALLLYLLLRRMFLRREAIEAESRASAARFADILDLAGEAIVAVDGQQRIVLYNRQAAAVFGYDSSEVLGQPLGLLLPQRFAAAHVQHVRDFGEADGSTHLMNHGGQVVGRRRDGTEFPAEGSISKLVEGGDRTFTVVLRDVSERRQAEAALRESEERYRGIFEAVSDGLIVNSVDGTIVDANPAACKMNGYSRDEMLGLSPTQFIRPDYHHVFAEFLQTIERGEQFFARAVNVRRDGTEFPVEVWGKRLSYHGKERVLEVVRDITREVATQQALEKRVAERTRELATLLEVSRNVASTLELGPLLGLILDQLRSVVAYTNASIKTVDGQDLTILESRDSREEDLQSESTRGIRLPLERYCAVWEAIGRGESVLIGDVRGETPLARAYQDAVGEKLDGVFGEVRSWLAVPLTSRDGVFGLLALRWHEPDHYTAQHAELAKAFAAQASIAIENARLYERSRTLAALEERQRLARELHDSVSQALYGIALGAKTARALLEQDPRRAAEPVDYVLGLAEAGLAEMRALIFELRPESLETEGLVAALEKQVASVRARHGIDVRFELGEEPDVPLPTKEALYRIAQESLQNVVKHAKARRVDLRLAVDGRLTMEVADDGIGFDSSATFPGHLGLKSMAERAARIGGKLEIVSRPGDGSRLTVVIPA